MDSTFRPGSQHHRATNNVKRYPLSNVVSKSETTLPLAQDGPPLLRYDIASKKWSIAIQWAIIISCNALIPVILYFALRAGTSLSKTAIVNIIQIPMTVTVISWPHRLWKLLRRNGERAPQDRTILTWDVFQWLFLMDIPIVTAFCVVSSDQGSLRVLALGPVVLFTITGLESVLTCWMCSAGVRMFCRMSSIPAGSVMRPAVYAVIEDITAVDGGGGQDYRKRLNERYEASPPFRRLIYNVSLYLGIALMAQVGIQLVVLLTTSDEVSYAVSTGVLWAFAGLSAWWGVFYTKRALNDEKLWWKEQNLQ